MFHSTSSANVSAATKPLRPVEYPSVAEIPVAWLVALVVIVLIWGGVVAQVTDLYFDRINEELIADSQMRAKQDANSIGSVLERRLETIEGITQYLSQSAEVFAALNRFGSDVQPSSLGRTANIERWGNDGPLARLGRELKVAANAVSLDAIFVVNAAGDCIASSNAGESDQFVGTNFADRQYFQMAQQGQQGQQYAMGKVSAKAGLYFSAPIIDKGKFIGAVVGKRNLDQLAYLVQRDNTFLVDDHGVVILSQNKAMEMSALAEAGVNRLSSAHRLLHYRRDTFPQLSLIPWSRAFPQLTRLQGQETPMVLGRYLLKKSGYQIFSLWPIDEIRDHEALRNWFKLGGIAVGTLLILVFIGTAVYVRTQSQYRRQLDESERSYRGIFNSLDEAIYVLDEAGYFLDVNAGAAKMYGQPREYFIGSTPALLSAPGRNDLHKVAERHALAYAGEPQTFEFWAVRANGEVFPKEVHLYPAEHFGKKVVLASAQDITERKRMEEAGQLAQLVYQNTSEGMLVCDAENRIIAVNPAFTAMTGYTVEEAIGNKPHLLNSGNHSEEFYRKMWEHLDRDGSWQGEIWNRRKNGEVYPEWLTINTTYYPGGSVHRRVALFSDISKRKESEEVIWRQANFDMLTALPNRRMFRDRLEHEIGKAIRDGGSLALLFIDLDRFKEVNDTLGHEAGDQLLVQASKRISDCLRETDTVARLGGDEFTVILPNLSESAHVDTIAQALLDKLSEPFELQGEQRAYVSASVGIALFPDDGFDAEVLVKHADQAMYAAKAAGRNCYAYFTASLQETAQNRLQLANALRSAMELEQLHVVFQPIVRLSDGHLHKAEALLRWVHPVRGLVSPAEFIPLAEEIGLISDMGNWVFEEAMRKVSQWMPLHHGQLQISVNMSPLQFHSGRDTASVWLDYLHRLDLSGSNVIIEITEGLLLHADPTISIQLLGFRDMGIQVAIDDFGTGYSSLAYLQKFDIDYLKIDQAFVRALDTDSGNQALVEAIVVMVHKLGLKVIAEGVETAAQRDFLRNIGCDYAQGYLFAKPLQPDDFEAMLRGKADSEI